MAESHVLVNSFEYDHYIGNRNNDSKLLDEKYCVFLDTMLPSHPDFSLLKEKSIDASSYYRKVDKFFCNVEETFRLKVVIAAHPKRNYLDDSFGIRPYYQGKTLELVKNCEFVIAHASTSIAFAVLFKKPIIFIYDNEIRDILYKNVYFSMLSFAGSLGSDLYNIDDFEGFQKISSPKIDRIKYEEYKYRYLTSKIGEGKSTKDIFVNYILQS